MKVIHIGVLLTAATLASGCATYLNEKTQPVNVSTSNGQVIKGTVNGVEFSAPGIVFLNRENSYKIFSTNTPGCVQKTVAQQHVSGSYFGNGVFGSGIIPSGSVGTLTDNFTGKMWKYDDNIVIYCGINTPK
ncbi:hypothetical protein [Ferrovum myxofaciens]|uniref:Lipoprotein n=1 Tax=Ferrovum myxofaciens TaxID=416213 RepID=A0A9E6SXK1_9PROT|nr:hypothetical protein [Ferrovum myxofaciens]QKE39492.1 MAG: hypothetical protein HO273_12820 [Ferrovum myxofaciens]QWY74768.1 MAG: hypothetical protein JVY19_13390 [Ferrovum myxofaciens]QWY77513.1 MAG: hypothetical protein JZL65_00025 [Ferrovum myxofaciens]